MVILNFPLGGLDMAFFRGILFLFWFLLVTMVLAGPLFLLTFLVYPFDRSGNLPHLYLRIWGRLSLIFIPVKIRDAGKILKGGVLFVSNHQGNLDILILNGYLKSQFRWISKKSLFSVPVIGWAMYCAGYIPLERGNREDADRMIGSAVRRLGRGTSIVIFPEGTWGNPDGTLRRFKTGFIVIARSARVPIQPITITGSTRVQPQDSMKLYPGTLGLRIGDPVYPEEFGPLSDEELLELIRGRIERNLFRNGESPEAN